jgi:RimJ/RimL family protein N-acetyltransferase
MGKTGMSDEGIKTKRLVLRQMRPSDAEWMAREIANPRVQRWLTAPPHPYRLEHAQDFIAASQADANRRVIEREGAPCGVVTLGPRGGDARDLGYWLQESAWGQGLMPEAAAALVDWHWQTSSDPLTSGWILGNAPSAQILTQLGFEPTGQATEFVNFFGEERVLERVRLTAPHAPLFTCRTERLVLNALTMDDLASVHAKWGAPEIARMTASITPDWALAEARAWLSARLASGFDGVLRVIRLRDGTLIGMVGMGGAPRSLSYLLGAGHWGQGYASEALRAFLKAAQAHFPQLAEIHADILDDNPGSIRLVRNLGFQPIGPGVGRSLGRVEPAPATLYRLSMDQLKA